MISKSEDHEEDKLQSGEMDVGDFNANTYQIEVHLLAANARISPPKLEASIPQAELWNPLHCSSLELKTVSLSERGSSVMLSTENSTC